MLGATLAPWELEPWHTDQPALAAMAAERMKKSRRIMRNYYIHNPPTWYDDEDQEQIECMDAPDLFDCIMQDHGLQLEIDKTGYTDYGCYNSRTTSKVKEGHAICAAVFGGMTSDPSSCTMRLDNHGHASWSGPRLQTTAPLYTARAEFRRSTRTWPGGGGHVLVRDGPRSSGGRHPPEERDRRRPLPATTATHTRSDSPPRYCECTRAARLAHATAMARAPRQ